MKLITKETLEKWDACKDGYDKFNKLLPEGADLQTASKALIDAGRNDYSDWLWGACKKDKDYIDQTSVTAGDWGTASAGYGGTASAGYCGTASAGEYGTASAGRCGAIVIEYNDGSKFRKKVGAIGDNGLKPNVLYKVVAGEFVEVKK